MTAAQRWPNQSREPQAKRWPKQTREVARILDAAVAAGLDADARTLASCKYCREDAAARYLDNLASRRAA